MRHFLLDQFAYRIHIGADVFLVTIGAISLITLLTVSFHAIKTAVANPVRYLKAE